MKNRLQFILLPFMLVFAAFFMSCSNGSGSSASVDPDNMVYLASSGLSGYMQKTVNDMGLSASTSTETVPKVFVVKGSDLENLSEEKILLAVRTCLEGKTFLIDSPSIKQIIDFETKVQEVLESKEEYEYEMYQSDISPNSIYNLLSQFQDSGESDSQKAYEAIGLRQSQVYFVHDIDEIMDGDQFDFSDIEEESATNPEGKSSEDENLKENPLNVDTSSHFLQLTEESIENFVIWINDLEPAESLPQFMMQGTNSAIEDAQKAQSFVHNFTAKFNRSSGHYDGRYNDRYENVQVFIDVWTACDINNNTDYYLVRTSAVCNNQQLNYLNDWDGDKYISPYMNYCEVTSGLKDAFLKTSESKPTTSTGSSSYTTGTSFSIGGNIGFNTNGPTGGMSGNFTVSESRSQSIPDIKIDYIPSGSSSTWKFYGPDLKPYWSGLYTHCDGAKDIQHSCAIFDTYALYTMPSSNYWAQGKVPVGSQVKINIQMLTGWISGIFGQTINWLKPGLSTWVSYTDYVKKPSNTFAKYFMNFKAPEGTSSETKSLYNTILKEFFTDWGNAVNYYGMCDTSATLQDNRLDSVAKSHFSGVKKTITTNKNILKDRGFTGSFTFYIQNEKTGTTVDSFSLTF